MMKQSLLILFLSIEAASGAEASPAVVTPDGWTPRDTLLAIVVVVGGAAYFLSKYRAGRKDLADELRLEQLAREDDQTRSRLPQPVRVKAEVEYVTSEQLRAMREEVAREIANLSEQNRVETVRLAGDIAELKQLERGRTGELHGRLDEINTRASRMEGRLESLVDGLAEIRQLMLGKGSSK